MYLPIFRLYEIKSTTFYVVNILNLSNGPFHWKTYDMLMAPKKVFVSENEFPWISEIWTNNVQEIIQKYSEDHFRNHSTFLCQYSDQKDNSIITVLKRMVLGLVVE